MENGKMMCKRQNVVGKLFIRYGREEPQCSWSADAGIVRERSPARVSAAHKRKTPRYFIPVLL